MVREYVGARYVPIFDGDWDINKTYEPLTIVNVNNVGSYTSKKFVPAGINITNQDYWALSGNVSGQMVNLQNQVDALDSAMTNVQLDISALQGSVLGLDNSITTITSDIGNIQLDISDLQGSVLGLNNDMAQAQQDIIDLQNAVAGKKCLLVIGNSYVNYDVCDELCECFDDHYEITAGGAGFVAYTGHTKTYEGLLDDVIAGPGYDLDKITDVLFVSAVGDSRAFNEDNANYKTALNTSLASIVTKIKANMPHCNQISITLAESRGVASFTGMPYTELFFLNRILNQYALPQGIRYLGWSGFNAMLNSVNFQSDNYHPSTTGAKLIGAFIVGSYFGHVEYKPIYGNISSRPCGYTASATVTGSYAFDPYHVQLNIRRINTTAGAACTLDQNDMFIAGSDFSVPIPSSTPAPQAFTQIIDRSTGNSTDYYQFTLNQDSNGIMQIRADTGHIAATAAAAQLYPLGLSSFTYEITA